uniref:Uncharacterized protein n=1 Tax=Panagrolaimus sp. ES5 TaxID=591445 RepID=A0AC34EZV1_9BILA
MSDGLKYGLIGIGVLVFLLIVGGGIYGIYTWRKSKNNPKPAPSTTVIKDETPNEKIETKPKLMEKKPEDVKNMKNETKAEKRPKAPPTDPSAEPEPPQQLSKELSVFPPSAEPSKPLPEVPKANITLAELITRAERNRHRGKLGDTFDRLKKPAFENIFESMIRHKWISENEALVFKEKHPRPPSEDELLLFSLPIGDMFLKLERMIDAAIKRHHDHPEGTPCRLIRNPNVTYFVSHFAIVLHYAQFFKLKRNDGFYAYSVPLCLGIAMDRNQDIPVRRRALVAMVQTAVDLTRFFNEGQCLKLPYPMNTLSN